MLVVLPHGACVDPEIVKMIVIRADRKGPAGPSIFTVAMKTDADDAFHVLAAFDDRQEAEALSLECALRVNKALGVESEGGADAADDDDDDDVDVDADAPSPELLADDDDW